MANQTITFTACDNELYVLAVPAVTSASASYELIHIQSGNGNTVSFTLTVSAGAYSGAPQPLNGVNGPLTTNQSISIPAGTYNLLAVGINWGIISGFSFYLNGNSTSPMSFSGPLSGPLQVSWVPIMSSAITVS